jgi:ribosome biogenesis GTPase A
MTGENFVIKMLQHYAPQEVLYLIERNALLTEIVQAEPDVLNILINSARLLPDPHMTRWHAYESLKRQCHDYIGWGARKSVLATSRHYEAFLQLIDALLPKSDEYYGVLFQDNMPEQEQEVSV